MLTMGDQSARSSEVTFWNRSRSPILGTEEMGFEAGKRKRPTGWVKRLLCQQECWRQGRQTRVCALRALASERRRG